MILQALVQYYDRLVNAEDGAKVPVFGFSEEKISYVLVLSESGELVDVVSYLTSDKKPQPKLMSVPRPEKRTSGINPNFLWDKTSYLLGVSLPKDKKSATTFELTTPYFEAFKKKHLSLLKNTEDPELKALSLFLQEWKPENFATSSILKPEMLDANMVFRLDGIRRYLHDAPEAKRIWSESLTSDDAQQAICLITGKQAPISRLHPAIKGAGGQSSGVSIVSFNKESFESYGKKQGNNAPVSEAAAFAYTTALNYLLRREHQQSISLGDTTLVFWALADKPEQAQQAEQLFQFAFNPPSVSDEGETTELHAKLSKIAKGRPLAEIAPNLDSKTQFFILGLAPNAARLSIRFWLQTDFGHIQQALSDHFQDLALDPLPWKTEPSIWRLLLQLVPYREGQKASIDDAPAHLAGELMRSILTGQPYPKAILSQVLLRFRSDGHIDGLRVALVKAVLQRLFRKQVIQEEIPMGLDETNTNTAYLLGRLFAVLENTQRVAQGDKVNATITDKYYASASTVPYSVYPRLLAGSRHHLSKIRKDKAGFAVNLEKEMSQIMALLPTEFPKHFSIENQGRFSIGYYHQKNSRFAQTNVQDSTEMTSEGEA